ncbi:hypothetical protein F8M41_001709 [Gigaspora margarita]|uniref:Uncharacterized protein n=1 Tax=Gigaspora margarita TaxID=4874 RepID=A0A8H4A915_GIGMA|nr:hypothetical protein F8M41_001709 [Gigaspora margarita]
MLLGCQALYAFDNATSHATFLFDTLIANYMNLSSSKNQEKLYSKSYFYEERKYDQGMVFLLDYCISKLCEEAKGLKEVLTEKELWSKEKLKLNKVQELMS